MYSIHIVRSAEKELNNLPEKTFEKIALSIDNLAENPRPEGVKKLKGFDRYYRIRVGDYRIVYSLDDRNKEILITRVRHRKDAY